MEEVVISVRAFDFPGYTTDDLTTDLFNQIEGVEFYEKQAVPGAVYADQDIWKMIAPYETLASLIANLYTIYSALKNVAGPNRRPHIQIIVEKDESRGSANIDALTQSVEQLTAQLEETTREFKSFQASIGRTGKGVDSPESIRNSKRWKRRK